TYLAWEVSRGSTAKVPSDVCVPLFQVFVLRDVPGSGRPLELVSQISNYVEPASDRAGLVRWIEWSGRQGGKFEASVIYTPDNVSPWPDNPFVLSGPFGGKGVKASSKPSGNPLFYVLRVSVGQPMVWYGFYYAGDSTGYPADVTYLAWEVSRGSTAKVPSDVCVPLFQVFVLRDVPGSGRPLELVSQISNYVEPVSDRAGLVRWTEWSGRQGQDLVISRVPPGGFPSPSGGFSLYGVFGGEVVWADRPPSGAGNPVFQIFGNGRGYVDARKRWVTFYWAPAAGKRYVACLDSSPSLKAALFAAAPIGNIYPAPRLGY
ncbi:hypothetical protein, partial [Streptomyces sp. NPDC001719]